ncbi:MULTISPECIES: hypothetical protein [Vagococcus]|uniref:Fibronectin type-III domain-containing protein n=1 Tax=Vagococcus fluvialis bH819 TaxID=1255619 RepID=A0A1X6WK09_9ENTE|nr:MULTISPECIES: hypothetical protein [Vagococcus]SLM84562.1 hypothetical protein FM121_00620 [Vagococcus fluvialis bH819]HCM89973.1 endo-beta-N-acetylglucosaminidase [Vagococcus sp.]
MKKNTKISSVKWLGLSLVCGAILVSNGVVGNAGDTWPAKDESKIGKAQPHFSGYRVRDIEKWDAQTDPYSEFMKAEIPLQEKNKAFRETQANPELTAPVETMLMQGDYGNSFMESTIYNNDFGNLAFNFWQYTDLFSPWHGAATIGTPSSLYDPATSDWRARGFEFGIVNIPNQAYINAAHKNGVKAIACVYFDPYFRPGQTKKEMFEKDANGEYIIAKKLIELADYYGIDGFFLNDEESGPDEFKELMIYLTKNGLYTQFYNTNSFFDESKQSYLKDSNGNQIHNSVFVNYGWPSAPDRLLSQIEASKTKGYDPYKEAFIGVEALQAGFKGGHPTSAVEKLYLKDSKNPMASIALFTPSDYYQRELDTDLKKDGDDGKFPLHQQKEYQWMIANRERMYFSGVKDNPRETGRATGAKRSEVGVNDASKWAGVADFKAENSVIRGKKFYSNFNIGKGMAYYTNGKVSSNEEWSNLNDQDILPTWQWWLDSDKDKLSVDFDFGKNEERKDVNREKMTTDYAQQGAYQGGNSLVTYGSITSENTLRLFKTSLDVVKETTVSVTAKTNKDSEVSTSIGLIFEDQPEKIEKVALKGNKSTNWEAQTISLEKFAGRKVAMIALIFDGDEKDFQYNLGEISFSDDNQKPSAPKDVKIDQLFNTKEANISWTPDSYETVDKYRIYSLDNEGNRQALGGIYGSNYYIKDTKMADEKLTLEVVAVGKNGLESEPTKVTQDVNKMISDVKVAEAPTKTNLYNQAANLGKVEVSWQAPKEFTPESFEIFVQPINVEGEQSKGWRTKVSGNETQAVVETGKTEGMDYNVTVQAVKEGQSLPGVTYRGKLHDDIAKNLTVSDIKVANKGTGIILKSPLTQDWRYVRVFSKDKEVRKLERGVTTNYDNAIKFENDNGKNVPLRIQLEDYAGNISEDLVISTNSQQEIVALKAVKDSELEKKLKEAETLLQAGGYTEESLNQLREQVEQLKEATKFGYLSEEDMAVGIEQLAQMIAQLEQEILPEKVSTDLKGLTVMKKGDEKDFKLIFTPESANVTKIDYKFENEGVVTVENQKLAAKKIGMTRVTGTTKNGKTMTFTVRVTP